MAVLVESISIVLRLDAIDQKFRGGAGAFQALYGAVGLASDGELVRLGMVEPNAAYALAQRLEAEGLVHLAGGAAVDFVVIDQLRGMMSACDWCEYGAVTSTGHRVQAARLKGSQKAGLAVPLNWAFEHSQSDAHVKIEAKDLPPGAQSLGHRAGLDAYKDPQRPARTLYVQARAS